MKLNNELVTLQRELARKNNEMERLNAQKNEFLSVVARDLRNPLGIIQGYSEFLLRELPVSVESQPLEVVQEIHHLSKFMADVVNKLLGSAALEAGTVNLNPEPVNSVAQTSQNQKLNRVLAARTLANGTTESKDPLPIGSEKSTLTAAAPSHNDQPGVQPGAATEAGVRATILVADDDLPNQKVMVHVLRRMGYSADAVVNGKEAVAAVEGHTYQLVFMDIHMPEMNGLEATRKVRALPLERQPHIYALTAAVSPQERQACYEAGMEGFLSKPIARAQLIAVLEQCGLGHGHA